LVDIAIGGTPSRDIPRYWAIEGAEGFPWLAISDLHERVITTTKEQITSAGIANSNVKPVAPGTVLMSFKLSLGRMAFAGTDLFTNEAIAAFKSRGEIDEHYLYYVLPEAVRSAATDVAIKGATLNKKSLAALPISHPALNTQKAIAQVLASIDTAVEKTEALIAKHQQIKAGLMHDLFIRGVLPNGQLRPPRSEAPELYQETAIGWIPKTWEVGTFGSQISIIDPNPSHRYPSDVLDGVPICSTENFSGEDDFDLSKAKPAPMTTYQEQNARCQFSSKDVVFARKGRLGLARRYGSDHKVFSHTVVLLKPKASNVSADWVLWAARADWQTRGIARRKNSNSGLPTLGVAFIAEIEIPFPHRFEQEVMATILDKTSEALRRDEHRLSKLKQQKLGLMQDLLTGRVPVPTDSAEATA
jgi:type I restriction enzyme S subunit